MSLTEPTQPPVVGLEAEGPMPQRRWTVALRVIIALPAWLYVGVLNWVAQWVVIAIWIVALITGRVPEGLGEFMAKIVQYGVRVNAYAGFLLTDKYPPWNLDADYAVSLVLPPRGRLNRAAVFFRLILLVPTAIVFTIVGFGLWPVLFFVWLIVLVAGRMPNSVWEALCVIQRYQARFYAYAAMLTPEYPRGLFGDKEAAAPAYAPPPLQEPMPAAPPIAPMPPAVDPLATFEPGAQPRVSRFVLSKAAKRIVVLVVVLGSVLLGSGIVLSAIFGGDTITAAELRQSYEELASDAETFGNEMDRCAFEGAGPECLHGAAANFAVELEAFRTQLRDLDVPAEDLGLAKLVEESIDEMLGALRIMATTSDLAEYQTASRQFQEAAFRFDRDVVVLHDAIRF